MKDFKTGFDLPFNIRDQIYNDRASDINELYRQGIKVSSQLINDVRREINEKKEKKKQGLMKKYEKDILV